MNLRFIPMNNFLTFLPTGMVSSGIVAGGAMYFDSAIGAAAVAGLVTFFPMSLFAGEGVQKNNWSRIFISTAATAAAVYFGYEWYQVVGAFLANFVVVMALGMFNPFQNI